MADSGSFRHTATAVSTLGAPAQHMSWEIWVCPCRGVSRTPVHAWRCCAPWLPAVWQADTSPASALAGRPALGAAHGCRRGVAETSAAGCLGSGGKWSGSQLPNGPWGSCKRAGRAGIGPRGLPTHGCPHPPWFACVAVALRCGRPPLTKVALGPPHRSAEAESALRSGLYSQAEARRSRYERLPY